MLLVNIFIQKRWSKIVNKTLTFNVNGQQLSQLQTCQDNYIVQKTLNYLEFAFQFSTDWETLEKHIYFKQGKDTYEYILQENSIKVPNFLVQENSFQVFLVGYNIEEHIRITTNTIKIGLKKSDYTTDISHYDDDIQDIYTLIIEKFDDYYTKEEISDFGYTKAETDELLSHKSNVDHTHTSTDISDFSESVGVEVKASFRQLANRIRSGDG